MARADSSVSFDVTGTRPLKQKRMAKVDFKPIYALVGADPFLQLQKLNKLTAQFAAEFQRVDFEGDRAELSEVFDELRSFAMFGGGKLVVIRDADEFLSRFRSQLEEYVANPSSSSVLVLRFTTLPSNQRIYKAIAKVGQIESCAPPKEKDLPAWIIEQGKSAHGIVVDRDAAALLAELIGAELGRLNSELAKLAISAPRGRVSAEQVGGAVAFQREREMWDMTNELAAGHPAEALRRWRQLLQLDPSTEFRAATWLTMWLENVRKALALKRKGMNTFAICSQLRIWPRENQEPFMRTAISMGETGARRALALLAKTDQRSKSGVGEAATNIEQFILALAQN